MRYGTEITESGLHGVLCVDKCASNTRIRCYLNRNIVNTSVYMSCCPVFALIGVLSTWPDLSQNTFHRAVKLLSPKNPSWESFMPGKAL